ncbi:MAG: hypothetical protein COB39_02615 [Marinosulfonomonas sp.]|nr:MAG: hypothetical protein COB39_02615 [Marinosulfonomonas sp.]
MNALISLHNSIFERFENMLGPWFLPTLARFTFAATLLLYFLNSARTKIGEGFFGFLDISRAYGQIFPQAFEAAGYDDEAMSAFQWFISLAGTWAEFILPVLILIGLFTRLAALGMIGFIIVQSLTDIYGHMVEKYGVWFDRISDGVIMDQRLFWVTVLLILVVRGAGPLSLDRLIQRNT